MKKLLPLFLILALFTGCSEEESGPASLQEKAVQLLDEYRFDEADSTYFSILRADTTSWAGPEASLWCRNASLCSGMPCIFT